MDLLCDMGSTWAMQLTVKDADLNVVDLTGCTVLMQIRNLSGTLLETPAYTIPTPANGIIYLTLSSSDTKLISTTGLKLRNIAELIDNIGGKRTAAAYHAVYAVDITYADNTIETLVSGKFGLIPDDAFEVAP